MTLWSPARVADRISPRWCRRFLLSQSQWGVRCAPRNRLIWPMRFSTGCSARFGQPGGKALTENLIASWYLFWQCAEATIDDRASSASGMRSTSAICRVVLSSRSGIATLLRRRTSRWFVMIERPGTNRKSSHGNRILGRRPRDSSSADVSSLLRFSLQFVGLRARRVSHFYP